MAKKPNASDKLMAEKINYGGEIKTRAAVVREMKAEGHSSKAIDRFAFGTPALTSKELDNYEKNMAHVKKSKTPQEPVKGVKYGKFLGTSGRTRNLYDVQSFKRGTTERRENAYAYGQVGVRQAKRHIHTSQAKHGQKALKFHTYNKTKGKFLKKG